MNSITAVILLITALSLYGFRKSIARAIKRAAKRQMKKLQKWAKRRAELAWTATKVQVARRTIGGLA